MCPHYSAIINTTAGLPEDTDTIRYEDAQIIRLGKAGRTKQRHFDILSLQLRKEIKEAMDLHTDPRGILFFQSDYIELASTSYAELIAEISLADTNHTLPKSNESNRIEAINSLINADPDQFLPVAVWAPVVPEDHIPFQYSKAPKDSFYGLTYQLIKKEGLQSAHRQQLTLEVFGGSLFLGNGTLPESLQQNLDNLSKETGMDWRKTQIVRLYEIGDTKTDILKVKKVLKEIKNSMGDKFTENYEQKLKQHIEEELLLDIRAELDPFFLLADE